SEPSESSAAGDGMAEESVDPADIIGGHVMPLTDRGSADWDAVIADVPKDSKVRDSGLTSRLERLRAEDTTEPSAITPAGDQADAEEPVDPNDWAAVISGARRRPGTPAPAPAASTSPADESTPAIDSADETAAEHSAADAPAVDAPAADAPAVDAPVAAEP